MRSSSADMLSITGGDVARDYRESWTERLCRNKRPKAGDASFWADDKRPMANGAVAARVLERKVEKYR